MLTRPHNDTDWEKLIKKIEDAEQGRQKNDQLSDLIRQKVNGVEHPLQTLKIVYANQTKGKSYSDEEDRYLLVELAKYGVGKEDTADRIKADINASPLFLFDWFIKSRTPQEIGRRCTTLVSLVAKEYGVVIEEKKPARRAPKDAAADGTKKAPAKRKTPGGTPALSGAGDDGASASSRASTPALGGPPAKKARGSK